MCRSRQKTKYSVNLWELDYTNDLGKTKHTEFFIVAVIYKFASFESLQSIVIFFCSYSSTFERIQFLLLLTKRNSITITLNDNSLEKFMYKRMKSMDLQNMQTSHICNHVVLNMFKYVITSNKIKYCLPKKCDGRSGFGLNRGPYYFTGCLLIFGTRTDKKLK